MLTRGECALLWFGVLAAVDAAARSLPRVPRRSLVETQMFRWKKILGAGLSSRKLANQAVEARIKAKILNIFASVGMPKTETVTA